MAGALCLLMGASAGNGTVSVVRTVAAEEGRILSVLEVKSAPFYRRPRR